VDVISIAEELGVEVYETNFPNNNMSGFISFNDKSDKPYICVNKNHPSTRKQFTIAHELGHFVLHNNILQGKVEIPTFYKSGDGVKNSIMTRAEFDIESPEYRAKETEANKFAADLLMPKEEFINQVNKCDNLQELASVFRVSVGAASIRASNLGIEIF